MHKTMNSFVAHCHLSCKATSLAVLTYPASVASGLHWPMGCSCLVQILQPLTVSVQAFVCGFVDGDPMQSLHILALVLPYL